MLPEDIVTAVANKQFHIWPLSIVDQGIELLTGLPTGEANEEGNYPEGTVHHIVQARLLQLAQDLKAFGDSKHDSESDEEDE
jgi:hypothetical protein